MDVIMGTKFRHKFWIWLLLLMASNSCVAMSLEEAKAAGFVCNDHPKVCASELDEWLADRHAVCEEEYVQLAHSSSQIPITPLVFCTISSPKSDWRLLRATTECGGDSCSNLAWIWNPAGDVYFLDGQFSDGELLIIWDDFIVTETLNMNRDQSFTPSLVLHEFTSHPTHYLSCGSPSISPDGQWLWCRTVDGSTWRASLNPKPGTFQQATTMQKMAEYQGKQPLYVQPYAWILPAAVTFEKSGFATIRYSYNGEPDVIEYLPLDSP